MTWSGFKTMAACKDMDVSQAAFFIEVNELDQKKGSNSEELKKMG